MAEDMMVGIDMALDDLITQQRKPRRFGAGGGKRRAPHIDEPLAEAEPRRRFGGGGGRSGSFGNGGGRVARDGNFVWINIAGLPASVLTADLQELFQDFTVYGLGVHFNEFGQHMGTADLYVDPRSAQAIIREFANIAIDGQKIRFAIVNDQVEDVPQFQRRFGAGSSGTGRPPMRNRFRQNRGRPHSNNSGQSTRTYSRSRSPINRGPFNKRAAGGGGPGRKNSASGRPVKSQAELDRELEAYMKGSKHPRIKLDG